MDKYLSDKFLESYKFEDSSRTDSSIHISDIAKGFCSRKFPLCLKNKINFHPKNYFSVATLFTFEIGKAIQSIVTNRYRKAGILVGTWTCLNCKFKFFGLGNSCPKCGKDNLLKYQDTTLVLNKYGIPIVGNIDILSLLPDNNIGVIENKSIKPESFDLLTEPELDHKTQLNLYLWMLKSKAKIKCKSSNIDISKYKINTKSGIVQYCVKTQKQMPFKFFRVKYDSKSIKEVESSLELVKEFTETGRMPKPICNSKSNLMAKNCHIRDTCFEGRKEK